MTAGNRPEKTLPKHWDKMVSAAYLRLLGHTQVEVAAAVGRKDRTIRDWGANELWPQAQQEARHRWLDEAGDMARRAVFNSLKAGNANLGMDLLGRIDPALSTKAKVDHTGIPATQVHVHQAKGLPDKELFATRDAALAKAFGVG